MEKKVAKASIRTFLQKMIKPATSHSHSGFTMIEMLVVISIIVLIFLIALPNITGYFQISLNAATRDMATTIKEAYNSALLTGKVYRMVYDLKENTYWVETGPKDALLDTKESKEKEEMRLKFSKKSDKQDASNEFNMDKTVTRKKISLPRGVSFEDVFTQQSPDPIKEGTAYSHFFPNGLSEQTIVHLKDDSKHHASLVVNPLIGITDVYDRYVSNTEIFEKK